MNGEKMNYFVQLIEKGPNNDARGRMSSHMNVDLSIYQYSVAVGIGIVAYLFNGLVGPIRKA